MKITGHLCTFNDCEYLDAVIRSFKNHVDRLYLIEGSWRSSQGYDGKQRSERETYNILDRHIDNKKVFLIQANAASEKEQRQIGLEKAKEDGADWHWFLDSDEIYPDSVAMLIKARLSVASPIEHGFRVRSFNFINSFNRWYPGDYARIARVTPQARFFVNNDVAWEVPGAQIVTLSERWRYFHYNYVKKDPSQFWRKMHYHETEDPTFKARITPQYGAIGHIYTIPNDIQIFDFAGKHPAIMKDHPNIVANIYNDVNLSFSAYY